MTNEEILAHVDHTLLKATASWAEIDTLCAEAVRFRTASVCVPPSYVRRIRDVHPGIVICTVIGFPLGYSVSAAKLLEAEDALVDGADELDMVINIGDIKNGDFNAVRDEISALRKTAEDNILKVIVETCYLTAEEKIRLCEIVTEAGADYIKTSTGFGPAGAALEDVLLFKEHIGPGVKIKAAGGIRTREDLEKFLISGCDRIGTSSAVALLTGGSTAGY
ncbi:MAG: deoxyribose-phosphate aldolase [Treponema sp.]|jgi:deoxyribose-phosphate aldolase|nr:deoxyribose-phosphate aldolase [Treponema sp.]